MENRTARQIVITGRSGGFELLLRPFETVDVTRQELQGLEYEGWSRHNLIASAARGVLSARPAPPLLLRLGKLEALAALKDRIEDPENKRKRVTLFGFERRASSWRPSSRVAGIGLPPR